jgi:hypothetical protein
MSVEFKVIRLGDKVVSVSTDSPHLRDWSGEIPLVSTERGSTTIYKMPDDQAEQHLLFLMMQK